ncbi:TetR family transcriptional regulator [Rhodococcus opacus]|uniref:TetR family transcriptional regulator n=1 Tax=Rhodococcus opacus TaxID=37919 RepID=UPI000ADEB41E|nr:TetR family transcriptional regulator [Rhodococcus opacus]
MEVEAGVAEFSSFGLAGARVDRIAEKAGVNKERIYQYFDKKEAFFSAVLEHELATTLAAVELSGHGVAAIADYAGRRFDYQREHPTFTRLLFWEGLELEAPVAEASPTEARSGDRRQCTGSCPRTFRERRPGTAHHRDHARRRLGSSPDRRPAVFDTSSAWPRPGRAPTRFHRNDS